MEELIVKELSVKFGKKEEAIKIMLEKCIGLGYSVNEFENMLQEFIYS